MSKFLPGKLFFILTGILSCYMLVSCGDEEPAPDPLPVVSTGKVVDLSLTSVMAGGTITSEGTSPVTERGVCWCKSGFPTVDSSRTVDGSGKGTFASTITGLAKESIYVLRAYATNAKGTSYGKTIAFMTGSLTDADGNIYHIVKIGDQVWMLENLKTTHYNDSTPIRNETDAALWASDTSARFCWYNNDMAGYKDPYGALYNWYAVNTGKLCPPGWHVPSIDEWARLVTYLGGTMKASNRLREAGDQHWVTPNTGAINSSGFTALPGNFRSTDGSFGSAGFYGYYWTTTNLGNGQAISYYMISSHAEIYITPVQMESGLSVRCIRDPQ